MLKTMVDNPIAKDAAVIIDASRYFLWSTVLEHLRFNWGRTRFFIYTLRRRSCAKIQHKIKKIGKEASLINQICDQSHTGKVKLTCWPADVVFVAIDKASRGTQLGRSEINPHLSIICRASRPEVLIRTRQSELEQFGLQNDRNGQSIWCNSPHIHK